MFKDFDNEFKENHSGYVIEKFIIMVYYLCILEQERDGVSRLLQGAALSFSLLLSLNLLVTFSQTILSFTLFLIHSPFTNCPLIIVLYNPNARAILSDSLSLLSSLTGVNLPIGNIRVGKWSPVDSLSVYPNTKVDQAAFL